MRKFIFGRAPGKQPHKPSIILSPGEAVTHRTVSRSSDDIRAHAPQSRLAGRGGVSCLCGSPLLFGPEQRENPSKPENRFYGHSSTEARLFCLKGMVGGETASSDRPSRQSGLTMYRPIRSSREIRFESRPQARRKTASIFLRIQQKATALDGN